MSRPLPVLTHEALALSEADRLSLAAELINSVEGPDDEDWTQAWADELKRRGQAADQREDRGSPWPDVRERLLERLSEA